MGREANNGTSLEPDTGSKRSRYLDSYGQQAQQPRSIYNLLGIASDESGPSGH